MPRGRRSGITAHLRAARRSLTDLNRALHRLAESVRGLGKNTSAPRTRRKLTLTPARRAALKLQVGGSSRPTSSAIR